MNRDLSMAAARLFTVGFHGKSPSDDLSRLIERGVGGVIFFSRNIGSPPEVAALTSAIKRLAARPLVLSLDQEGGQVARLKQGFTEIPTMRAVGASGNCALARDVGVLVGRELQAVGFDFDYAPVLDVDTNPDNPVIGARAFGRDPELVGQLGVAFAAGLASAGVASCGKHFPGHGDTSQDSHLELPRLGHSLDRLRRVELAPFAAAIRAQIPALMTAHVIFEPLDPKYPATMSRALVHDLLREELGYDGLVVSDDIEMRAIADHYGIEEAVVLGVNAGIDQFLCCHSAEVAERGIDAVIHAVEDGRILWETLARAEQRVERFTRNNAGAAPTSNELPDLTCLDSEAHRAVIERVRDAEKNAPSSEHDPTADSRWHRAR